MSANQPLLRCLAFACTLGLVLGASAARTQAGDLSGVMGGIMQGAIQADLQRQRLELERQQLELQRLQLERQQLELRRQGQLSPDGGTANRQIPESPPPPLAPPDVYKIDGWRLADVLPDQRLPDNAKCLASDQFANFRWCRYSSVNQDIKSYTAILLSSTNSVTYYTKFYESAKFGAGAIPSEIERLSTQFHAQARKLTMPGSAESGGAIIATWGALIASPIDSATLNALATGKSVEAGILVDFIGDIRGSAKRGLPVYRLTGGPGFYWNARFDRTGNGSLRFGIADPAMFDESRPKPNVSAGAAAGTGATDDKGRAGVARIDTGKQITAQVSPAAAVPVALTSASASQFSTPDRVTQGKRVALVIGNSAYRSVAALPNPSRDAEAIAQALRSVGFTSVHLVEDATLEQMREALKDFQSQADGADWALVYYAGHGIEVAGQNYLIPIDAHLRTDRDVDDEALTLGYVLGKMQNARKLHLVILDACRENPFQSEMKQQIASRSITRGLARFEPTLPNEMVVYAAKDGELAEDGADAGHSPFAQALIARIAMPNVEINKVFRMVTSDVLRMTDNKQQPFVYGSSPGDEDFYFRAQ